MAGTSRSNFLLALTVILLLRSLSAARVRSLFKVASRGAVVKSARAEVEGRDSKMFMSWMECAFIGGISLALYNPTHHPHSRHPALRSVATGVAAVAPGVAPLTAPPASQVRAQGHAESSPLRGGERGAADDLHSEVAVRHGQLRLRERTPELVSPPPSAPEALDLRFFFFFTLVPGPSRSLSLKLSDTRVCEPQVRARLHL